MIKTGDVLGLKEIKISFTKKELSLFAHLSGDFNPMHMDALFARKSPYGQQIVFGALSTIACLQLIEDDRFLQPSEIEVFFEKPVFMNKVYSAVLEEKSEDTAVIGLYDGQTTCLRLSLRASVPTKALDEWVCPMPEDNSEMLMQPMDIDDEALISAYKNVCAYNIDPIQLKKFAEDVGWRNVAQGIGLVKVLSLCSYIIGMEFPGKRALFSKLHLELSNCLRDISDQLVYSISKQHYDEYYRMLDLAVEVGSSGVPMARGTLKAFVHKKLPSTDPLHSADTTVRPLNGKTALVIGGSRGLGAAIVRELVIQGYQVVTNYYKSTEEAKTLQAELNRLAPSAVHIIEGNAADEDTCERMAQYITAEFGRLDLLVLNAFHPPLTHLSPEDYVQENLKLFERPFEACKDLLATHRGCIVGISSIYVKEGPKELANYIEAKKLAEAYLIQKSEEYSPITILLARPPQLLTDMNNTPTGWIHAQPPDKIAKAIVDAVSESVIGLTEEKGVQWNRNSKNRS